MIDKVRNIALSALALGVFVPAVSAATPDGDGPWADSVVTYSQGLTKSGAAVPAARSNPEAAVGVAEDNTVSENFFSLGFGGSITLEFENGVSEGVSIVEATNPGYATETVNVEVSADGVTYVLAGEIATDGSVSLPQEVPCAHYVRITDTSDISLFPNNADAYDVDGVMSDGPSCQVITETEHKMTGGGSIFSEAVRMTHGFNISCDGSHGNLQVNWGKKNRFHMTDIMSVMCTMNDEIDAQMPESNFNTQEGEGMGRYNGEDGYKIHWVFTDAGEPGTADSAMIEILSPDDEQVALFEGTLDRGNHQAH